MYSTKHIQSNKLGIMKNNNIKRLSQKLFSQFETMDRNLQVRQDSLDQFVFQYKPMSHPLQNLLSKANSATKCGANKMKLAKKTSQQQDANVFLTGAGITQNAKPEYKNQHIQVPEQVSPSDILKQLMIQQNFDDLSQLRKMLKETGQNIQCCRKKVYKTQKNIANYACGLTLNDGSDRKITTMNKIIQKYR